MNRHAARRILPAARRITGYTVANLGDLIRACALLAFVLVIVTTVIPPEHGWKIDTSPAGTALLVLALLGVERVGLALYVVAKWLGYVPPKQPTTH
jgi:hypothetical protein